MFVVWFLECQVARCLLGWCVAWLILGLLLMSLAN